MLVLRKGPNSGLFSHSHIHPSLDGYPMPAAFAIPEQTFLALGAVELGRFITNVKQPHLNYFQPQGLDGPEELTRGGKQLDQGSSNESASAFTAELTRILSSSLGKHGKMTGTLKAESYRIFEMANTKKWFKDALKSKECQEWVEESLADGEDIYLVTGFLTLQNAKVEQHGSRKAHAVAKATVPLDEAVRAATGVSPGNAASVTIAGKHNTLQGNDAKFQAQNEQICSVQFQKLGFRWYSGRTVDKAVLEKNAVWKAYRTFRGEDPEDQLDIVEALLEDDFEGYDGPFEVLEGSRFYV
jgi:hypothetical protein